MTVSFDHRASQPEPALPRSKPDAHRRRWLDDRSLDDRSLKDTLILAALFMSMWLGALLGMAVLLTRRI
jgi:hypothetical protein